PIARASCILQATHTWLDQVLITFGTLYKEYSEIKNEDGDQEGLIQSILDSLDKCWMASDQDIFVAAVFCNLVYKILPFSQQHPDLTLAGFWTLLCHLWKHFYNETSSFDLFNEVRQYCDESGSYRHLAFLIAALKSNAESNGTSIDPLDIYSGIKTNTSNLQCIAHCLLSVVANSASCEQLFSMFGITLTHLCSQLRSSAMTSLAELRMYLHEEHVKYGLVKEQLK
ncbi:hypothetical protein BDQ17DRAFT_1179632, partial [Cyathus striatus]